MLSLLLALLAAAPDRAAGREPPMPATDLEVKAALILNFAKFAEWPPGVFGGPDDPMRFCVLGREPLGVALERIARGKTINGRRLLAEAIPDPARLESCHIVFIGASEDSRLPEAMPRIRSLPVLTFGDTSRFLRQGGIVRFVIEEDKVHFEINIDAEKRANLRLSPQLLSLAKIVTDHDEPVD